MSPGGFRKHLGRHGVGQALLAYAFALAKRFVDFDVMHVASSGGPPRDVGTPPGYETRQVDGDEYCRRTRHLTDAEHRRDWAFARGDRCFASLLGEEIVGYTFYSEKPTVAREGLSFTFAPGLLYSYASYTHPEHRGKRLPQARANARRLADGPAGASKLVVLYISLDNSASRAAAKTWRPEHVGYLAYVRIRGRFFCFASRGCRRLGIALRPDESARATADPAAAAERD